MCRLSHVVGPGLDISIPLHGIGFGDSLSHKSKDRGIKKVSEMRKFSAPLGFGALNVSKGPSIPRFTSTARHACRQAVFEPTKPISWQKTRNRRDQMVCSVSLSLSALGLPVGWAGEIW